MKVNIEEIDHWIGAIKRMKTEFEFDYDGFDSSALEMAITRIEVNWNEVKKNLNE